MYGIIVLIIYALIIIGATKIFTKSERNGESFHVGDRKMGTIVSAMSIAATWIWAPALFTSAEKAYINGFAGLFWFLVPNVLCLMLFIPFAKKIRREMPNGITLSGYMHKKYNSNAVKKAYGDDYIPSEKVSKKESINSSAAVGRRQDTEYGYWITTRGYDCYISSYSLFLFTDIRNKGFGIYGCYTDDILTSRMCDICTMGHKA